MKYKPDKREIILNRELNDLDKFVLDFIKILEKYTGYVIVSGYVSIILGRSRATEDIDLLVEATDFSKFKELFNDLGKNGFECMNTSEVKDAYEMIDEHAIRFFREIPVPHIEFKKIKEDVHRNAFAGRISVKIGRNNFFISSLELQIPYKLSLMSSGSFEEISSDKDFEDAKHLYELFKETLNKEELLKYVKLLGVEDKFELLKR